MRKEEILLDDSRALLEQGEQFLKQFKTDEVLNDFLTQLQERGSEAF